MLKPEFLSHSTLGLVIRDWRNISCTIHQMQRPSCALPSTTGGKRKYGTPRFPHRASSPGVGSSRHGEEEAAGQAPVLLATGWGGFEALL